MKRKSRLLREQYRRPEEKSTTGRTVEAPLRRRAKCVAIRSRNILPAEKVREALEVHHIRPLSKGGADARSNMIVVSATLHTLIHADENCVIDLATREMTLFGVRVPLRVEASP